jgi:hypothetical protein
VSVQTFGPEATGECFDEGVVSGLAWFGEVERDATPTDLNRVKTNSVIDPVLLPGCSLEVAVCSATLALHQYSTGPGLDLAHEQLARATPHQHRLLLTGLQR